MSASSGLLALPADIPAELRPLLLSQHLPESPIAGWEGRGQPLNLRDADVAMGSKCSLASLPGEGEKERVLGERTCCPASKGGSGTSGDVS